MKIKLRFFAALREALDTSELEVDTAVSTIGELRVELCARGPKWAEVLARGRPVRASLDQVMVDEGATLAEGAEVAFFPPVTGG
jgi:sulfur-carrier protein